MAVPQPQHSRPAQRGPALPPALPYALAHPFSPTKQVKPASSKISRASTAHLQSGTHGHPSGGQQSMLSTAGAGGSRSEAPRACACRTLAAPLLPHALHAPGAVCIPHYQRRVGVGEAPLDLHGAWGKAVGGRASQQGDATYKCQALPACVRHASNPKTCTHHPRPLPPAPQSARSPTPAAPAARWPRCKLAPPARAA